MVRGRRGVLAAGTCLVASVLTGCEATSFDPALLAQAAPRGPRFIVAHRGAHLVAPENSLEAIREAGREGARFVEVDVRTTKDDELVIMHDESVDRTTDGSGSIRDLRLAELRALKLERADGSSSTERVPTLAEALEAAAKAPVALYLDVKDVTPARLARALAGVAPELVLVYQDDLDWIEQFHELAPGVPLLPECGSAREIRECAARFGARAFASEIERFEPEHAIAAHEVGGVVIVDALGLDDSVSERALDALKRGADGVQTDAPALVHSLLDRSGP